MKKHLILPVLKLLKSSWTDIKFDYGALTPEERACIAEDDFLELVDMIRREEMEGRL